jgi:hypothetical protein
MPAWVMLQKAWSGIFSRHVRDEAGKILRKLVFEPGVPTQVADEDLAAIMGDLGKALLPIEEYVSGHPKIIDMSEIDLDAPVATDEETEPDAGTDPEAGHDAAPGTDTGAGVEDPPTTDSTETTEGTDSNGPDVPGRPPKRRK